jgi:glutamate carboxypeptidase
VSVADLLAAFRRRTAELLDATAALVSVESPSEDVAAVARCADTVAELGAGLLGAAPERVEVGGWPHLRWRFGRPRVVLVGHLDTVWPLGTLDRWPFAVDGQRATGPGVFDMKAGVVLGLFALAAQDDLDGVALVLTGDEELGSPTSRDLVVDSARGLDAALVLEPGLHRALKVGRKGVARYTLTVEGRAAHAGLEPDRGVNALTELVRLLVTVADLADRERGTSVTPTRCTAGTAVNVIPALATATIDVRVPDAAEARRVDSALRALGPRVEGVRVSLQGGIHRPPLERSATEGLFRRAVRLGEELGLGTLRAAVVGGGSDGNLTAAAGTPTLDGLGAVGAGAHAEGEHILVSALAERAALLTALVGELLAQPQHVGP